MTPCMGGWCLKRDKCARYRPGRIEQDLRQRLCGPKETEAFIPIYPAAPKEPQKQTEAVE